MLTQDALADCRFCSQVSKGNGEDPIGTAGTANHWLVMELPQPWTEQMFKEDPRITPLIELFKKLFIRHGIMMQPVRRCGWVEIALSWLVWSQEI